MLYRVINAEEVNTLVSAFMESYEVIAPVKRNNVMRFDVISSAQEICVSSGKTQASLRKYFLPSTETLFTFNTRKNNFTNFEMNVPPRVIFGVHACDINALNRLDLVFRYGKYPDPYYVARRRATLIIGVGCMPDETCFCNVLDSDEAHFGYDLFLQDLQNGHVLVSISSVEAANILEATCTLELATNEDRIAFRHITRNRQLSFSKNIPDVQQVAMLMDVFHSDAFWNELSSTCLSCSACAAVCPTCFCFDITDTCAADGCTGERCRVWDACTSPQFAVVAGGHNFRATPRERVRHRMYHKLNGFLANHDRMLCVGCGRCVRACKANINPIRVLEFFERKAAETNETN